MEPKRIEYAKILRLGLVVLALSMALFKLASVQPAYAASDCRQRAITGGCDTTDQNCIRDYCAEDAMRKIMDEVSDEINEDVKREVRRETAEVVAEEEVSPSGSLNGLYVGLIDDVQNACSFTFTNSSVEGVCHSSFAVIHISGLIVDFDFNISRPDGCNDSGGGSLEVLSGTGEPGTELLLKLDGTDCNPSENDAIMVKQ